MAQGKKKRKVAEKKANQKVVSKIVKKEEPKIKTEKSAIGNKEKENFVPIEKKDIEKEYKKKKKEVSKKTEPSKIKLDISKNEMSSAKKTTKISKQSNVSKNVKKKSTKDTSKKELNKKNTKEQLEKKEILQTNKIANSSVKRKKSVSAKEKDLSKKNIKLAKMKKPSFKKKKSIKKHKGKKKQSFFSFSFQTISFSKIKQVLLSKETWKLILAKILLFLSILGKTIQKYGHLFYDFLKTFCIKIKKQGIHFFTFLKIECDKIKKLIQKWVKNFKIWFSRYKKSKKIRRENHRTLRKIAQENKFAIKEAHKKEKFIELQKTEKEIKKEKEDRTIGEKQKKRRHPVRSIIILGIFLSIFFIGREFSFGIKEYASEASSKIVDVPKFSFLKEECCNFSATFSSIRSVSSLKEELEKILSSYQKLDCDNKNYYYNPVEDYTITDYSIKKGFLLNEFVITYGKGNSCELDTTFKKLELLSDTFSIEDAKRDGNYVISEGKVYNASAYDTFKKEVENHNPNTLRIVTTTKEGDVLITDVEYLKEGKFKVTYDKTRDKNSKQNYIVAYKFEHIGVYKNKLYAYNGVLNGDVVKTKNAYYLFDVT